MDKKIFILVFFVALFIPLVSALEGCLAINPKLEECRLYHCYYPDPTKLPDDWFGLSFDNYREYGSSFNQAVFPVLSDNYPAIKEECENKGYKYIQPSLKELPYDPIYNPLNSEWIFLLLNKDAKTCTAILIPSDTTYIEDEIKEEVCELIGYTFSDEEIKEPAEYLVFSIIKNLVIFCFILLIVFLTLFFIFKKKDSSNNYVKIILLSIGISIICFFLFNIIMVIINPFG